MFPFGVDVRQPPNMMTDYDAQSVLKILARHYLVTNLYVRRPDGRFAKLSEFLDRDSLMLLSRFPELIPAHPVFEGGHYNVDYLDHMYITVGRDDAYYFVRKSFASTFIEGHGFGNLFTATASGEGLGGDESALVLEESFLASFDNAKKAARELSVQTIEETFSKEIKNMESFLAIKGLQFYEITGYRLPVSTVILNDYSEYTERSYSVSFGDAYVPPHILAAFYVFAGLY